MAKKVFDITKFAFGYLVFYSLWGWIYTHTIYAKPIYVYGSFILLTLLFLYINITEKNNLYNKHNSNFAIFWLPYFLLVGITYLFVGQIEAFAYRLIVILLLLIPPKENVSKKFPYHLLLYGGLVTFAGIFIQIMLPNVYYSVIFPIFTREIMELWADAEIGFNGIIYQTGLAAPILIFAEFVTLYKYNKIKLLKNKRWIQIVFILLLIAGVFLTGKRIYSLVSIIVPILTFSVATRKKGRLFWGILCIVTIAITLLLFLESNAESLSDNKFLGRIAQTFANSDDETKMLSGRDELWNIALRLFKSDPIFGVGVEEFVRITETNVHNIYLQCLCEFGVFGFTLFIIPLILCLYKTIKMIRIQPDKETRNTLLFSLACQLNFIISGVTANPLTNLAGYMIYILAVTIATNIYLQPQKLTIDRTTKIQY